jgi:type IV pilus assembly protein PilW
MCSRQRSTSERRRAAGFTLIELMVGVMLGLLASLAVTHVLVNSEGQKRTTTSGSDAQVNGALALSTLERAIKPAGYGFAAVPVAVGCPLKAYFNGAQIVTLNGYPFPTALAPLVITDGAAGAPDTIRILASGKTSYSVPLRIASPGYAPPALSFPVASVRGVEKGDLLVAVASTSAAPAIPCEMFQATANPGTAAEVARADNAWNASSKPGGNFPESGALINLGAPIDTTYSIATGGLTVRSLKIASDANSTPSYPAANEVFPNIVQLQAFYGKDTNADGSVDLWNASVPTTSAEWQQVMAVRLAVVARSTQYEKDEVTSANLSWDVGNAGTVTGSAACGSSKCVAIKIDTLADWKHYRYKVFETVIPLRNMLWNS